jgi:hypothetical protein
MIVTENPDKKSIYNVHAHSLPSKLNRLVAVDTTLCTVTLAYTPGVMPTAALHCSMVELCQLAVLHVSAVSCKLAV